VFKAPHAAREGGRKNCGLSSEEVGQVVLMPLSVDGIWDFSASGLWKGAANKSDLK
tara:strand:- start:287 stop:454 length:168 start_codon:yes stop_codon:yes gene_type:complete